ncbi:hypothetical protein [Agrococcus sp. ARC_14]|uniref:hypothetical protein n=1 Tax=Agrococcus sp. ARC_14 TaxID=2919927 RepID=UPI001F05B961|nr:hypothetical protein [Agrococcus sp. ARC_14]MCH1883165.1 hypothetical protein [Agrococcus sp. ARC_14]
MPSQLQAIDLHPARLHRPLLALTALMSISAVACVVLAIIAPVEILGTNGWLKPLKFSISIAIFAATIALILDTISQGSRTPSRRLWWMGTVIAVALLIEQVVIVAAVLRGTTSHFNVADPFVGTLWTIMGVSIAAVWVLTLVLGIVVWARRGGDPARRAALRIGIVVGLAGMAVAFFMTSPSSEQLRDFQGIAGAHAVGIADGGPGIPLLGWSTVGGDLRAPHFIGMHALQGMPLLVWGMERLAARVPALRRSSVRTGFAWIAGALWAGVTAITTWQALLGESVLDPSLPIVLATSALFAAGCIAVTAVLRGTGRETAAAVGLGDGNRGR